MSLKVILIILGLMIIISLALFGSPLKEKALKGIVKDIPEYNCGTDDICTSCIIGGHTCSCGTHTCSCGNKTVDKVECQLYN